MAVTPKLLGLRVANLKFVPRRCVRVTCSSRVRLCDPMACSLPGSSVHEILQQEYWRRLPYPPPGDLPHPGTERMSLRSPVLGGRFFTTSATWEACPQEVDRAFLRAVSVWDDFLEDADGSGGEI